MVELLRTKIFIPGTPNKFRSRPRLVKRLNTGPDKKLTLFAAPGGLGKTTQLVEWLKQVDHPVVWLSQGETDNDQLRFLTYMATAFQRVAEQIGAPFPSALQSPQLPAIKAANTNASYI